MASQFYKMSNPLKKQAGLIKNPHSFIERIKTKKQEDDYLAFATLLKKLRTEKNITIAELSKDICSISYLSKLENGLIQTNECTINLLFERLGVDFHTFKDQNKKIDLHEIIGYYADNDIDELKKAYDEANKAPLNILIPIINALYSLAKGDITNALKLAKELEPVKDTLGQFECVVFLFIVVEIYTKLYNFDTAYDYLKLSELIDINDDYLKLLLLEAKLKTAYHLNNSVLFLHAYEEFNSISIPTYPLIRRMEVRLLYELYSLDEYPNHAIDYINQTKRSKLNYEETIVFYYYSSLIKAKVLDLEQVYYDMLKHEEYFIDGRIIGLFSYIVLLIDKDSFYQKLISITNNYDFNKTDYVHQKFVCFVLMYGSRHSDKELLDFIRSEILVSSFVERYHIYNETYKTIYLSLLAESSHYKEAYQYLSSERYKTIKINKI